MIGVTMSEQDGSEATEIQVELIQLAGHAGGIVFQAAVDKDEAVRGGHGVGRAGRQTTKEVYTGTNLHRTVEEKDGGKDRLGAGRE